MVPGSTVKFTITATGGADLACKWQKIGADLDSLPGGVSGETTDTLRIDKVKKSHDGTYTCIVSNAAGSTPSNSAQLTVRKFLYLVVLIHGIGSHKVLCVYMCLCVQYVCRLC